MHEPSYCLRSVPVPSSCFRSMSVNLKCITSEGYHYRQVNRGPHDWRVISNSSREMRRRRFFHGTSFLSLSMKHRFCAVFLKTLYNESETEENLKR
jgi:hypothetical protein